MSRSALIIGNESGYFQELKEMAQDAGLEPDDCFGPEELEDFQNENPTFVVAIGDRFKRAEIFLRALKKGGHPSLPLIHSTASISQSAKIGNGTHVNRLTSIASGVSIGQNCQINRSCSIGHNVTIADHVSFGPGVVISGNVTVSTKVLLGAGCVILPGVVVGENATIGAGSVVTKSVAANETVIGNPARPLPVS